MNYTLILLPVIIYFLLTLMFTQRIEIKGILEGFIKAYLAIFLFIVIATELLSSFSIISLPTVLVLWLCLLFFCVGVAVVRLRRADQWENMLRVSDVTPWQWTAVGVIVVFLGLTFLSAILYPPNNWDSMTYHMARVEQWISNKNISFFPTAITRQNYQMPLAEYAIMHLQVLTDSDRFANLVQWISYPVVISLGVLIAQELGLNNKRQLITGIIVTTVPMVILQASSTQNDLVLSSFIMAFTMFLLRIRSDSRFQTSLFAAIAMGLALLTKGTAYMYCAPIGVCLAAPVLLDCKNDQPKLLKNIGLFFCIVIVALLINVGHLSRNYKLYGHPLSTESELYTNKDMSLSILLANITRNGAMHLATPLHSVNSYLYRGMEQILGEQLNNRDTTWGSSPFRIRFSRHEDEAGNLIHMIVLLCSFIVLPVLWYRRQCLNIRWFSLGIFIAVVIFCLILKWQPWASRLHTPIFLLVAPLLALTIDFDFKSVRARKYFCTTALFVMCIFGLFFALFNKSRPVKAVRWWYNSSRSELYFANKKPVFKDYNAMMDILTATDAKKVGLLFELDDWEYPLWVLAREKNGRELLFKHVRVNNRSAVLGDDFPPEYVITVIPLVQGRFDSSYVPLYNSENINLYKRSTEIRDPRGKD